METKNKEKHTPTPWETFSSKLGTVTQIGSGKEIIAHGVNWPNARFIIRAVNEYESLKNDLALQQEKTIENAKKIEVLFEAARRTLDWYRPIFAKEKGKAFAEGKIAYPPIVIEALQNAVAQAEKNTSEEK